MYGVHSHVYSRMICGRQPPGRVISNFVSADIGSILFLRRFPLLFGDVFSCVECVWGPRYTDIARAMTREELARVTLPTTSVILFAIEWGETAPRRRVAVRLASLARTAGLFTWNYYSAHCCMLQDFHGGSDRSFHRHCTGRRDSRAWPATSTVDIVDGHEGKDYWTADLPMAFRLMHTFTTTVVSKTSLQKKGRRYRERIEGGICFRLQAVLG